MIVFYAEFHKCPCVGCDFEKGWHIKVRVSWRVGNQKIVRGSREGINRYHHAVFRNSSKESLIRRARTVQQSVIRIDRFEVSDLLRGRSVDCWHDSGRVFPV